MFLHLGNVLILENAMFMFIFERYHKKKNVIICQILVPKATSDDTNLMTEMIV